LYFQKIVAENILMDNKGSFGSRVLEGRGGEIFNLKSLVQFLEGEGRKEQIFLKFDCIAISLN